jgi:hypothetical protein
MLRLITLCSPGHAAQAAQTQADHDAAPAAIFFFHFLVSRRTTVGLFFQPLGFSLRA